VNHFAHASYRQNRTIVGPNRVAGAAQLTVFVGLYDSIPYFDHLVKQISSQRETRVRWLFVDNASSDETWVRLNAWAATESHRDITLVRNGFNLGATGSIFVNLDLVTTEWLTFIHQDDIYLPHHLDTLDCAVRTSPNDVVGVFTDMARVNKLGAQIGSFPPPIWMLPDMDPPTVFLALLRNHCIPWSALAVRTQTLLETEAPWHSTAFPDTEITMRLAGRGRFVHLNRETMRYRDNQASESRSIDNRERKFGATVSLFRVFNSAEFASLADRIERADRAAFVVALRNATLVRLGDNDRSDLVIAGALERLEQLWDNSEPTGLSALAATYGALGAAATTTLLDRMLAAAGGKSLPTAVAPVPDDDVREASTMATRLSVTSFVVRPHEAFGYYIPYAVRRAIARRVIRALTRGNPLSAWRFEWR
jgi:hypothetical protein